MIRSWFEHSIRRYTRDGDATFFDTRAFPWTTHIENEWESIRRELESLLRHREEIPNFQDISPDQAVLTERDEWKTFFLYAYGHRIVENCARCPETDRLLRQIPGMKTAMFSILAAGKHIPEHRGPFKGVLRYHLGLIVPDAPARCRIRVGDDVRTWSEGKSLIFDDTHPHEVWNETPAQRVVLFVDFVRPLPFPMSVLNRMIIRRIGASAFVEDAVDRLRHPQVLPEIEDAARAS
jgi:ornithine lipid ester-linked acyl 2-hydroxylase